MRVTLIQCTNSKRDEPAAAKDLYDESGYFCDMRAYARAQNKTRKDHQWYILSAKHGLVDPETVLEPYDEFGLSEGQAQHIAESLASYGVERAEIVAGKQYTNPLVPELERFGIDVTNNFRGQRIGERRQELQVRTSGLINGSLC